MSFSDIIKAALELGVVPTLALFLVFAVYLQNRQLIKDRREMETRLLTSLNQVLTDYRLILIRVYDKTEEISSKHSQTDAQPLTKKEKETPGE